MKGFKVAAQQLGKPWPIQVSVAIWTRTKLHSFKSHNIHEDPGFGGPIPVSVGTFETK